MYYTLDWLCCRDLVGIDLCFKITCPCCCIYLYIAALEKTDLGWYRFMCLPCNRQLLATKYHIDESTIQSYCFHMFCCCLALQQEMYEVGEREEGKICCGCHGHYRFVESAHPKVVVQKRSSMKYKFVQTRPVS